MSRDITSGFSTELDKSQIRIAYAIVLKLDGGDIRLSTEVNDITYDGNIYYGAGNLLDISEISESQVIESKDFTARLSGIPEEYIAIALNAGYRGRVIYCDLLLFDGSVINPLRVFSGYIDSMNLTDDGETGLITVKSESDLSIVTKTNGSLLTPEHQKSLFPNDKGLDLIPISSDVEIVWGR